MKTKEILLPIIFILALTFLGYGQPNKDKSNYDNVIYRDDYPGYNDKPSIETDKKTSNQKLLFKNNQLKVSAISLQPGESKSMQPSAWPSVLYIKENADFTDTAGAVLFDTRKLTRPLIFPENFYKEPDTIHQITNLSATKMLRLIRVEMKQ